MRQHPRKENEKRWTNRTTIEDGKGGGALAWQMKSCQRSRPIPRRTDRDCSGTSGCPCESAGKAAVMGPCELASTLRQSCTIPMKETLSVHRARLRGKRVDHRITGLSTPTCRLASTATATPASATLLFLPTRRTSAAACTTTTATTGSSKTRWIPSGTKGFQVNLPLLGKMSAPFAPFQSI